MESSGYMERCRLNQEKYLLPVLGVDVFITLEPVYFDACHDIENTKLNTTSATLAISSYQITSHGMSKEEFGQVCVFLARNMKVFGFSINMSRLIQVSERFTNIRPPSVGVVARRGNPMVANILSEGKLKALLKDGFVVIDTNVKTSTNAERLLSTMLTKKSSQDAFIRTDSVQFLDDKTALDCNVKDQCDLLLGIAGYLNEYLPMPSSLFPPLFPATDANPLTNPFMVQAAAYRHGEYYVTHCDTTLYFDGLRGDHRVYTCILYCNEDYQAGDGGALRLRLNSQNIRLAEDFVYPPDTWRECDTVDIEPLNGRLVVFDSGLSHSVEKVLQKEYARLALTVWILRPQDRPLYGDILHGKHQT